MTQRAGHHRGMEEPPKAALAGHNGSAMDEVVAQVVQWLRSAPEDALDEKDVPGTTPDQRRALAAMGALVRESTTSTSTGVEWPAPVSAWLTSDLAIPPSLHDAFSCALRNDDGPQFLAAMYEGCVANVNRRHLGTFFTPPHVVAGILDRWHETHGAPAAVVDIGAGVGAFSVAAAERWPSTRVYAVDINPVTLGLLGALAQARGVSIGKPGDTDGGVRLIADDFMTWSPSFEVLPRPRLILGNPPYTRHQLLPLEDRQRLSIALPGRVGSRASLSTWMLAQSLELLQPVDGLALLLPAHWLEANYAQEVRGRIWELFRRRVTMHLLGQKVFPDARVDAVALSISPESTSRQPFTVVDEKRKVTFDRQSPIPATFRVQSRPPRKTRGSALSEITSSRRGTATGANQFFLFSEQRRLISKLPPHLFVPLVRRLRHTPDVVSSELLGALEASVPRWLLVARDSDRARSRILDATLTLAESEGVNMGVLCARRDPWFDLRHDLVVPDVVVSPTTRDRFGIATVSGRVAITNNLYGMSWHPDVPESSRDSVVRWLRSTAGQKELRAKARHHAHGLYKLEPGALKEVQVPSSVLRG